MVHAVLNFLFHRNRDGFVHFIGKNIRLEPVMLGQEETIQKLLDYYMGKNTPERKDYIMENLVVPVED